ncbi:MAG: aminotransferase class IV [Clostridium sp.]
MNIKFDEGYSFGLGVFETISVVDNHAVLLDYHLQRLNEGKKILGIGGSITAHEVYEYIKDNPMKNGVLKIIVSEQNIVWQCRQNNYTSDKYEKGFSAGISRVIRNETSQFTYIKSLNYGDNIIEKRCASKNGYDEPVFLNTKGQLTEGATSNIFFVKENKIFTPHLSCGMLNGTIRKYILDKYDVLEKVIYPNEVNNFDEMFLTNSLMGVMPVYKFDENEFKSRKVSDEILKEYLKNRVYL